MRYAIGALLLILVLVSAGCVQQLAAENETVKIGVLEPLSGVRAEAGQYVKNALELALDEINNDTSRRYRIQLIYEDSQYDPKVAVSGFQKLKDIDNVKFIIGEHGSSPTLAVAPLAEEAKIILISPAAQASELSKAGDYIFRTQINVAQEAPFLANFIVSVAKNETLHVIGINTDYTLSFMNSFSPEFERLGRKTGLVEKFDAKETDFRTILLKIQNEKPKYVLLLSIPKQAGLIIRQASELGMDVTWFAGSPIEGQEFFTSAGNVSATIIYSYPYDDVSEDTAMKTFREKYLTKYGVRNEMLSANAYDTLYIMSNCFEKVGIDVDAVKQ
jgi:branched-chain amino acid transport system substrate-binding protein